MNTGFADLLFKIVQKDLKVFWPCVAGSHWKSVTAEFLEWISFDNKIFFQQSKRISFFYAVSFDNITFN